MLATMKTDSTAKPYAIIDRSCKPLIYVTFTGQRETPENFENYLNELHRNYDDKAPIGLIFDAENAPTPNIAYQKLQAQWMQTHFNLIQQYCQGVAYIMPNPFLRPVLKMIFAIQRSPAPCRVFSNKEAGVKWLKGRCQ